MQLRALCKDYVKVWLTLEKTDIAVKSVITKDVSIYPRLTRILGPGLGILMARLSRKSRQLSVNWC